MTERFSLAKLRAHFASHEICYHDARFSEEIVWYGEQADGYAGWSPRELGEAKGYTPEKTEEDPAVMALIEVAEAACAHVKSMREHGPTEWPRLQDAVAKFEEST